MNAAIWIILFVIILIAIILIVVLVGSGATPRRSDASRSILYMPPTDPAGIMTLIDDATMFKDTPNAYTDTSPFGTALNRCTNAFIWAADGNDPAVASAIVSRVLPTFAKNVPVSDFQKKPFGPNWYQWGETIRRFYNAMWMFKPDALPDLQQRIEIGNSILGSVGGVAQIGSNYALVATTRAWMIKFILGGHPSDDAQVMKVVDQIPKLDTSNTLWGKSDVQIKADGSYLSHDILRGYGYLNSFAVAAAQLNTIERVVDTSIMDDALAKIAPSVGMTSPALFSRGLSNSIYLPKTSRRGISYIRGVGILSQSQPGWSYTAWGNNSVLAFAETDIGVTVPFNIYTTPFNFSINTRPYDITIDNWRSVPGVLASVVDESITGSTTVTRKTTGWGMAIVSRRGDYGAIVDCIDNVGELMKFWTYRCILITPNGIKVALHINKSDVDLEHTLYSGSKIEKSQGGWTVDNEVFVCGSATYSINNIGGMQVLKTSIPKASVPIVLKFNVMYKTADTNMLDYQSATYAKDGDVVIWRKAKMCALQTGNEIAFNNACDGTNTRTKIAVTDGVPVRLTGVYNGTTTQTGWETQEDILFAATNVPIPPQ